MYYTAVLQRDGAVLQRDGPALRLQAARLQPGGYDPAMFLGDADRLLQQFGCAICMYVRNARDHCHAHAPRVSRRWAGASCARRWRRAAGMRSAWAAYGRHGVTPRCARQAALRPRAARADAAPRLRCAGHAALSRVSHSTGAVGGWGLRAPHHEVRTRNHAAAGAPLLLPLMLPRPRRPGRKLTRRAALVYVLRCGACTPTRLEACASGPARCQRSQPTRISSPPMLACRRRRRRRSAT